MRQLTDVEKKFSEKNIQFLKDEIEFLTAEKKRDVVVLETAPAFYKKQIQGISKRIKEEENSIKELETAINTLENQIKNGVEEKNAEN